MIGDWRHGAAEDVLEEETPISGDVISETET
jgi:hypothetical protein